MSGDVEHGQAGDSLRTDLPLGVSAEAMAAMLAMTPRNLQLLAAEGVIPRAARGLYVPAEVVPAYIRQLRETAAGRGGGEATDAKVELMRLQAGRLKRQAALERGELVPRGDMLAGLQAIMGHCRARLLALPSGVAPRLEHLPAPEVKRRLTQAIHDVCRELSQTQVIAVDEDGNPIPEEEKESSP